MKKIRHFVYFISIVLTCQSIAQTEPSKGVVNIYYNQETEESIKIFDKSYSLIIANYDYTNGWSYLRSIRSECKQLADSLYRHGFDTVIIRKNRTKKQMMDDLEWFIENYGYDKNNRILIYYSGHGNVTMDGKYDKGYVVPIDAPYFKADADMEKLEDYKPRKEKHKSDQKAFEVKSIGYNRWISFAQEIKARHAILLFDCCFSGQLLVSRNSNLPIEICLAVQNPAIEFLTAGNEVQTVPEKSEFLKYFLLAISGSDPAADKNGDGYLKSSELFEYIRVKVNYITGDEPLYGRLGKYELGEFVFVLPLATKKNNGSNIF